MLVILPSCDLQKHPIVNIKLLHKTVSRYFRLAATNWQYRKNKAFGTLLDVHSANLIQNPRKVLLRICNFIGLECSDDYLSSCASVVSPKASITRHLIVWPEDVKDDVQRQIQSFPFLQRYTFTST